MDEDTYTAFKQQRLKAWQPILTPKTVLPAFFAVGAVFIPLGVGLYLASDKVNQVIFDYTNCDAANTPPAPVKAWSMNGNVCDITFTIGADFVGPVFMYYRLTNFYQNHRRYVKSFDPNQLMGTVSSTTGCSSLATPDSTTYPSSINVVTNPNQKSVIYPCGLIANSFFTDEISNLTGTNGQTYNFTENGIAWPADTNKFVSAPFPTNIAVYPPPLWTIAFPGRNYSQGYNAQNWPDLASMQRFQVWMRPAGLPNFRKLWGRLDGDLPQQDYKMSIVNNFNVSSYGGTKSIVISTVSILGGKNPFLGVAYMAVGALCWVLGIVFLLRHMIKPRKPGDYTYLSWNQPQRGADGAVQGTG
ncbi:hypothetical protein HK101_010580, partial [Irineochytrium annulatum]